MTLSQIRAELLQDHRRLCAMIDTARQVADRGTAGERIADELRGEIIRLADALRTHNLREEKLLRNVLPSVDAWGCARAEIMTEEHVLEHQELFAALLGIQRRPVDFAKPGVAKLF